MDHLEMNGGNSVNEESKCSSCGTELYQIYWGVWVCPYRFCSLNTEREARRRDEERRSTRY